MTGPYSRIGFWEGLKNKLLSYGICGKTLRWIDYFLFFSTPVYNYDFVVFSTPFDLKYTLRFNQLKLRKIANPIFQSFPTLK